MPDFIIILIVIFFFAFSIFIHELGHLLAALWRGLYVERFSIGFGPKLWGFKYKGIEYLISALPLGGYVSLPQMIPGESVTTDKKGEKLAPITPLDKIITAIAGPLFNFIFAFILSLFIWQIGKPSLIPSNKFQVVSIEENSPEYIAGVRKGDIITKINSESFIDQQDLLEKFITIKGMIRLEVNRYGKPLSFSYTPKRNAKFEDLPYPFMEFDLPATIGVVKPNGIAHKAGLRTNDIIEKVNGIAITSLYDFQSILATQAYKPLDIIVRRKGERFQTKLLARKEIEYRLGVYIEQVGKGVQVLGLTADSVARKAGFQKADIITKVNDKKLISLAELKQILQGSKPLVFQVIRNDKELSFKLKDKDFIYYKLDASYELSYMTSYPTPYEQFKRVLTSTFRTLSSLISPQSSIQVKHMSSVVGISKGLFDQIKILGIMAGISFLLLLNISLGVINLFPLPVLDGGHIIFALIEQVLGRELPPNFIRPILNTFGILLMGLMFYIIYHDILRLS